MDPKATKSANIMVRITLCNHGAPNVTYSGVIEWLAAVRCNVFKKNKNKSSELVAREFLKNKFGQAVNGNSVYRLTTMYYLYEG